MATKEKCEWDDCFTCPYPECVITSKQLNKRKNNISEKPKATIKKPIKSDKEKKLGKEKQMTQEEFEAQRIVTPTSLKNTIKGIQLTNFACVDCSHRLVCKYTTKFSDLMGFLSEDTYNDFLFGVLDVKCKYAEKRSEALKDG